MAIDPLEPTRALAELKERMNRLFEEALAHAAGTDGAPASEGAWRPAIDLSESDDHYVLRVDLPGVPPEDVNLRIEDQSLVIRGERRRDAGIPADAFLRTERPVGPFVLTFALPRSVDSGSVRAGFENGVLEVTLPRRGSGRARPVPIDVGAGR